MIVIAVLVETDVLEIVLVQDVVETVRKVVAQRAETHVLADVDLAVKIDVLELVHTTVLEVAAVAAITRAQLLVFLLVLKHVLEVVETRVVDLVA